jgi:hypothetical protein
VITQRVILPARRRPSWRRSRLGQAQSTGLGPASQLAGESFKFLPVTAYLGVVASERRPPGGSAIDGSATSTVQHQIGGRRRPPSVDNEAIWMMREPIKIARIIIDKALHGAHHAAAEPTVSCRWSGIPVLERRQWERFVLA